HALDPGSGGDLAVLAWRSSRVSPLIGDDGDLLSVAVEEFAVDEAIAFTKVLEIGRGQVPERFRREHRGILRIAGSEFVEPQIEQDRHYRYRGDAGEEHHQEPSREGDIDIRLHHRKHREDERGGDDDEIHDALTANRLQDV